MRLPRIAVLTCVAALLAAPSLAYACSLVQQPPLQPHIGHEDLRIRHLHQGTREAWVQSESWVVTPVYINQQVRLRGMRSAVTATFAQARGFPVMIVRTGAGRYTEDDDPATTCALAGQQVWSTPRLLVRETPRAIFLTAVSRRAQGSTEGCGVVTGSCDDLTLRAVTLDEPIGFRQLYFTTFS